MTPSRIAHFVPLAAAVLMVAGVAWQSNTPGSPAGASSVAHPLAVPQSMEAAAAKREALVEQLRRQPGDADGWQALGATDVVLHRYADASAAYEHASTLRPRDATLLAERAYALAMSNGRNLQGEPLLLLDRARALEPTNPKALALSGTAAFDRHDYAQALQYWELLARTQPADSVFAQRVQPSIAEARRLGGLMRTSGAPAGLGIEAPPTRR